MIYKASQAKFRYLLYMRSLEQDYMLSFIDVPNNGQNKLELGINLDNWGGGLNARQKLGQFLPIICRQWRVS